ncbi:MAG: type II toxin-antitoxin system VapC family toxin [Actinomycetes bacterium]
MSWYLDSSAILKLILAETESKALVNFLSEETITSTISRVEVIRTLNRMYPLSVIKGKEILSNFLLTPMNPAILSSAENFPESITLRSLDAIQVATVIFLDKSVEGVVTYDKQMIKNAKELGIKVASPGMK